MDLRDTAEEIRFRDSLRRWFDEHPPPSTISGHHLPDATAGYEKQRAWQRLLNEGGWTGLTWPRENGGRGASYIEQIIFMEEAARAGSPDPMNVIGLNMVGPTIIDHGTEQQKRRFLPPILTAEEIWCQGFSEPEAGSDVASLQTKAVGQGDEWIVSGQKVWTSYAHIADWCLLLVRTRFDVEKHRGLTCLLVDMHSVGIHVEPIRQIDGRSDFNEVFFDEVRVPNDHVLGEVDAGWTVATTTLMYERRNLGITFVFHVQRQLEELIELRDQLRDLGRLAVEDGEVRRAIARFRTEVEALRITSYRILAAGDVGPRGSLLKLHWSSLNQRITQLACEMLGPWSQSAAHPTVASGRWPQEMLRSRANTIEAGTSEILRNVVAQRVLGLPRSW